MGRYDIADFIAYDSHAWYRLYEQVNTTVWPMHVVVLACVAGTLFWSVKPRWPGHDRLFRPIGPVRLNRAGPLLFCLAAIWVWVGWSFHHTSHQELNWAASYWAAAFYGQAVLLCLTAAILASRQTPSPQPVLPRWWWLSLLLAIAWSPASGWLLSDRSPAGLAWFGVTPDATAWLTLLLVAPVTKWHGHAWLLIPIPVLSLLVSLTFAWVMPMPDVIWLGCGALGSTALVMICRRGFLARA